MSADNSWLRDFPQNSIFRFSAKSLSRGHYQPAYQPREGVYLLNTNGDLIVNPTYFIFPRVYQTSTELALNRVYH